MTTLRKAGIEVFYWLERWDDDQSSVFERAASSGFGAVEISFVAGLAPDVPDLRKHAADCGLSVLASTGLTESLDVSSPSKRAREAGINHLRQCIDWAHALGSPILGGVTFGEWLGKPVDEPTEHRKRSAESLAAVADHAADAGVDICLEVLNRYETFMFNTVEQCLEFIATVDHPSIKVELDTFHMCMEEANLGDAVRLAGTLLGHVQVAANNRKAPQYGQLDWAGFGQALDDVGYDEWVVFETFPDHLAETGRGTYAWRSLVHEDLDADARSAAAFIKEQIG